MKWVLFIIFLGTAVIPIAEYSDGDKCDDMASELQTAAEELRQVDVGVTYQYQCLPAPKKFLLFK